MIEAKVPVTHNKWEERNEKEKEMTLDETVLSGASLTLPSSSRRNSHNDATSCASDVAITDYYFLQYCYTLYS
jgi:hypothetical protein